MRSVRSLQLLDDWNTDLTEMAHKDSQAAAGPTLTVNLWNINLHTGLGGFHGTDTYFILSRMLFQVCSVLHSRPALKGFRIFSLRTMIPPSLQRRTRLILPQVAPRLSPTRTKRPSALQTQLTTSLGCIVMAPKWLTCTLNRMTRLNAGLPSTADAASLL